MIDYRDHPVFRHSHLDGRPDREGRRCRTQDAFFFFPVASVSCLPHFFEQKERRQRTESQRTVVYKRRPPRSSASSPGSGVYSGPEGRCRDSRRLPGNEPGDRFPSLTTTLNFRQCDVMHVRVKPLAWQPLEPWSGSVSRYRFQALPNGSVTQSHAPTTASRSATHASTSPKTARPLGKVIRTRPIPAERL